MEEREELRVLIEKRWLVRAKILNVRHSNFVNKCYERAFSNPDSIEAESIKDCTERLFECPKCFMKVYREQWDVRLGGMCRLCYRDLVRTQDQDLKLADTMRQASQDQLRRGLYEIDRASARKVR